VSRAEDRQHRFLTRWTTRVIVGAVIGAAVGAGLGVLAGLAIFHSGSPAVWGTAVAGLVFGFLFAVVLAGMSALGSPPPGREPEERGRRDPDVGGFTRDERA
jgi:amino acid transporter